VNIHADEWKGIAETVTARFRIVTPMFLGGAQHEAEGVRPPSVKGALRFWWRALNWAAHRNKAADDAAALQSLHEEEAKLFGRAAKEVGGEQIGGQGVFLLAVNHDPMTPNPPLTGRSYLAGMGLDGRQALPDNAEFEIVLRFRPATDQPAKDSVMEALRLFGLIGGLGSRSRRGFGSVTRLVSDCGQWRLPTETEFEEEKAWPLPMMPAGFGASSMIRLTMRWKRWESYLAGIAPTGLR